MEQNIKDIIREVELLKKTVQELKISIDIEPELRSEYIQKLRKIESNGNFINFNSVDDLRVAVENA